MIFDSKMFWVHMHDLPMACMNDKMGKFIGNKVGLVKACDVNKDATEWGQTLRVYIELELHKPISSERFINLLGNRI